MRRRRKEREKERERERERERGVWWWNQVLLFGSCFAWTMCLCEMNGR